jgi:hypothetical protein
MADLPTPPAEALAHSEKLAALIRGAHSPGYG